MLSLKTNLLMIGPWPASLKEIGAVLCTDLGEAFFQLQDSSIDVVALTMTSILEKRFSDFYLRLKEKNPSAQLLLVTPPEIDSRQLIRLYHLYDIHRILDHVHDPRLNDFIFSALEKSREEKQDQNLELLIQDQNKALLSLQQELEQRIEKRARSLSESRHRLRVLTTRTEALRRCFLAVFTTTSLVEIEKHLNDSLTSVVECSWIKIVSQSQTQSFERQIQQMGSFSHLQVPLFKDQERIASLFFMRPNESHFNRDEVEFLHRVAEAVALAFMRIQKLSDSQTMKEQWETTFDSMSDPIAIISESFDLIQTNSAGQKLSPSTVPNKKCYESLFNRSGPCPGCRLGQKSQIEPQLPSLRTYEVYSQPLRLESDRRNLFLNMYHDITEKIQLEKQIIDSAKRAELGTIGSSIAHELNNPLGGILTFTQILKSETPKDHALQADLQALEQGALKCKDIISTLLEFIRKPENEEISSVDLGSVIQRAFKLLEVKTKPLGIELSLKIDQVLQIKTAPQRLMQMFTHLLQQQIQHVQDEKNSIKAFIRWEITADTDKVVVRLSDSTRQPLWDKNVSHFSFSVVRQVLSDLAADLEIPAPSSLDLKAKISFSRPVLQPENRS